MGLKLQLIVLVLLVGQSLQQQQQQLTGEEKLERPAFLFRGYARGKDVKPHHCPMVSNMETWMHTCRWSCFSLRPEHFLIMRRGEKAARASCGLWLICQVEKEVKNVSRLKCATNVTGKGNANQVDFWSLWRIRFLKKLNVSFTFVRK